MPADLFPEVTRTDLFSYEAAISRLYTDVAETLFRTRLRAWPTTKIQAIACDTSELETAAYCGDMIPRSHLSASQPKILQKLTNGLSIFKKLG